MGKIKQNKRRLRQTELLKEFENQGVNEHYEEKKVGYSILIKQWNGNTNRWQVAVYSESSYNKMNRFRNARSESKYPKNEL